MNHPSRRHLVTLGLSLAIVLASFLFQDCANPVMPTGGPRDSIPPAIRFARPAPRTLRFEGNKVEFVFSEYVRLPAYNKEVLITPFVANPRLRMQGKRLTVELNESLRPDATYVVTLANVRDLNESNPLDGSYVLAFSTGDVIDSLEIAGKVEGLTMGETAKDVLLLLFDADSVQDNDFFRKRPAYLSKTDASGAFQFSYLRRADYSLIGIVDKNQSNSYDALSEALALAASPALRFPDTADAAVVKLVLFSPPPAFSVGKSGWLNDSVLVCEFSRALAQLPLVAVGDTSRRDTLPPDRMAYFERKLLINSPVKRSGGMTLWFSGAADSLGARIDTSFRPGASGYTWPGRAAKNPPVWLKAPALQMPGRYVEALLPFPAPEGAVSLRDSAGRALRARVQAEGFRVILHPDTVLRAKGKYTFRIEGAAAGRPDTVFSAPFSPFDPAAYGKLSLRVTVAGYEGPLMVRVKGPSTYTEAGPVCTFSYLLPGDYKVRVLLDRDGNGMWTPGSLRPYRLPERFIEAKTTLSVRANWEYEEELIELEADGD